MSVRQRSIPSRYFPCPAQLRQRKPQPRPDAPFYCSWFSLKISQRKPGVSRIDEDRHREWCWCGWRCLTTSTLFNHQHAAYLEAEILENVGLTSPSEDGSTNMDVVVKKTSKLLAAWHFVVMLDPFWMLWMVHRPRLYMTMRSKIAHIV